jgi:hypothetical protein
MQDRVGKVEIIRPVKVPGKDKSAQRFGFWRQHHRKAVALSLFFVALVVGGILLVLYLAENPVHKTLPEVLPTPELEKETVRDEAPSVQKTLEPTATDNLAQRAQEKREAEQSLADFLGAQKELDRRGAAEWGGGAYTQLVQLSQEADGFFLSENYIAASAKYIEATAKAKELAGQIDEVLGRLLDEASLAIAQGDGKTAQRKLEVALLIDPENETAQHGLERAKNVEAVMALLTSGAGYEENDNLSFALTDYQQALRLDPESKAAREAFERVKALISEEKFEELMSAGLTAYHKHDYQRARSALLEAQAFKPASRQVRDALAQVNEAIRLNRIAELRQEALAAEQAEDWQQALEHYLAVLEMDPQIRFAIQGRDRSLEQIRIAKRFNFYLERPSVLESERHLTNAQLLLKQVERVEPKGLLLRAQIEKLDQLVAVAKTPVRVILVSDNLTNVAVYRIGKLGQFDVRDLYLRPGTYTVVGARDGYQDFRQKIVVKPDQQPLRVTVICRVKI